MDIQYVTGLDTNGYMVIIPWRRVKSIVTSPDGETEIVTSTDFYRIVSLFAMQTQP